MKLIELTLKAQGTTLVLFVLNTWPAFKNRNALDQPTNSILSFRGNFIDIDATSKVKESHLQELIYEEVDASNNF